jgi:hypothetical protein
MPASASAIRQVDRAHERLGSPALGRDDHASPFRRCRHPAVTIHRSLSRSMALTVPVRMRSRPAASAIASVRRRHARVEGREEGAWLRARLGRVLLAHLLDLLARGEEAFDHARRTSAPCRAGAGRSPPGSSSQGRTRARRPRAARRAGRGIPAHASHHEALERLVVISALPSGHRFLRDEEVHAHADLPGHENRPVVANGPELRRREHHHAVREIVQTTSRQDVRALAGVVGGQFLLEDVDELRDTVDCRASR